jgi:hypothetical protein
MLADRKLFDAPIQRGARQRAPIWHAPVEIDATHAIDAGEHEVESRPAQAVRATTPHDEQAFVLGHEAKPREHGYQSQER